MFAPLRQKLLLTGSYTSAQSHTAVIDTLGYDRLVLGVAFSTVVETTTEITLKLGEGDTTSSFTDVTEFVGGGTGGFTKPAPTTATTTANTMQFDIDTRHRKRYLLLTVTPFTTKTITSWTTHARPEQGPVSVTVDGIMARIVG